MSNIASVSELSYFFHYCSPNPLFQDSSSQLMEECSDLEKLSNELKEVVKTLSELLSSGEEDVKSGYWYRKTKIINRVFFIFYIIAVTLFLAFMFFSW